MKKTKCYIYNATGHKCTFRLNIEQSQINDVLARIISGMTKEGKLIKRCLFRLMISGGTFVNADIDAITIQFYSPIYMLLTLCDREPDRETEALKLLEKNLGNLVRYMGAYNNENSYA